MNYSENRLYVRLRFAIASLVICVWGVEARAGVVHIAPGPTGEALSADYELTVDGAPCPVYRAPVASADLARRWREMDDAPNSGSYADTGAFASFDLQGEVKVVIKRSKAVGTVRVLPSSARIAPKVEGNQISFVLSEPRQIAVEVDGDWVHALQLFGNPLESNPPDPKDSNVIYFGPGIHEVTHLEVGDGKTLYLAAGAVLKEVLGADEPGNLHGRPAIEVLGSNITIRGRGIIDQSALPTHTRNPIMVVGKHITIEGIIFRNASTWNLPIRRSEDVTVRNVKILGSRSNSDGMDICHSRDVTVEGCYIRTLDDLVVVKTDRGQGPAGHIVVKGCVLWNEVAHALSVGAELREPVDNVLFTDCDVIHDKGREWTLRVYHCDSALVSNIVFSKLRIEETHRFASVWIGKAIWSLEAERGRVRDVRFEGIRAEGQPASIELVGFDGQHDVDGVSFRDVTINGKPLAAGDVKANAFVRGVSVATTR
jgi:hypothetical protein